MPKVYAKREDVFRNLKEAKKELKVKFVDFTGGEPLLHPEIVDFLKEAKRLKYYTSITTNTLLYPKYAEKLKGLVDFLLFSIDGEPSYHDENRGGNFFKSLEKSLKIAKKLKEKPELIFTVTDDSVKYLDFVLEFANKYGVLVQLNPVFSYFREERLSDNALSEMKKRFFKKNVYVNLAQLELVKNGGNRKENPRCYGVSANLVISEKNEIVLPCYHHKRWMIPIGESLKTAFYSEQRLLIEKGQGRYAFCEGCTINCYFDPSFEYKFDNYMVKSLFSRTKYAYERFLAIPMRNKIRR